MDRNSDYLKMDRKPRFYNIEREKIEIKKPNNSLNICSTSYYNRRLFKVLSGTHEVN